MHPVHAIEAGLAQRPATVRDLIDAIPAGELTYVCHRDEPEAVRCIDVARRLIVHTLDTGATLLDDATNEWSIFWHREWHVLRGHVFGERGQAEPTSPVLLVSRQTRVAIYGEQVPRLGALVLGNTLAAHALDSRQDARLR